MNEADAIKNWVWSALGGDVERIRQAAEGKASMSRGEAMKIIGDISSGVERARGLK